MTIEKYQELTGTTVTNTALTTAMIKKAQSRLEFLLGYTLDPNKVNDNFYDEKGISPNECSWDVSDDSLQPADEIVNAYRLYPYDSLDINILIDPAQEIHKVKLVYIRPNGEGITLKVLENLRANKISGFVKSLERCRECFCLCDCTDCVQIAVDADWMFEDCLPSELLYLWADMVTYNLNCKNDLKSETLGTHSYTRFDNKSPEEKPENMLVIQKYSSNHVTLL